MRYFSCQTHTPDCAVCEGYTPSLLVTELHLLRQRGRIYEVNEFGNQKRIRLGLPEITQKIEEVERLLLATGIEKRVIPKR
jgi:hypothetical protein